MRNVCHVHCKACNVRFHSAQQGQWNKSAKVLDWTCRKMLDCCLMFASVSVTHIKLCSLSSTMPSMQ